MDTSTRNAYLYMDTFEYGEYFKEYLVDSPRCFSVPPEITSEKYGCCIPCVAFLAYPCTRGMVRAYAKGNYNYVVCYECPDTFKMFTPTWECLKFGGTVRTEDNRLIDSSDEDGDTFTGDDNDDLAIPFLDKKPIVYSRAMCSFDYNIFVLCQ